MKVVICLAALFVGTTMALKQEDPIDNGDNHLHPPPLPVLVEEYSCKGHRNDKCTSKYRPVCGWFDPAKIQCFAYPCASNYVNACKACKNKNVKSVTCGQCPAIGNPNPNFYYQLTTTPKLPKC